MVTEIPLEESVKGLKPRALSPMLGLGQRSNPVSQISQKVIVFRVVASAQTPFVTSDEQGVAGLS